MLPSGFGPPRTRGQGRYNGGVSGGKRIFSEQEASEILQRAAKLQEDDRDSHSSYTPGITEDELERIAHEAGIDPNFLRRAMEKAIQRQYKGNHQGGIQQIGRRIFGNVMCGPAIGKMNITSRNGRTRIEVRTGPFMPLFITLYPAFLLSVFAVGIGATEGAPAIGIAIALLLSRVQSHWLGIYCAVGTKLDRGLRTTSARKPRRPWTSRTPNCKSGWRSPPRPR